MCEEIGFLLPPFQLLVTQKEEKKKGSSTKPLDQICCLSTFELVKTHTSGREIINKKVVTQAAPDTTDWLINPRYGLRLSSFKATVLPQSGPEQQPPWQDPPCDFLAIRHPQLE